MKIMFVIPSLVSGGAERVVSLLANSFCRSQHSIVIVLVANDNIDYAVSEQVKIINISDKWKSKRFFLNKIIKRISCIHQVVKSESPDVVISFMAETNIDTSIALIGCSTTLVVSERNDPSIDPQSRVKKLIRNIVYFRPEGFVFQTKEVSLKRGKPLFYLSFVLQISLWLQINLWLQNSLWLCVFACGQKTVDVFIGVFYAFLMILKISVVDFLCDSFFVPFF